MHRVTIHEPNPPGVAFAELEDSVCTLPTMHNVGRLVVAAHKRDARTFVHLADGGTLRPDDVSSMFAAMRAARRE